MKTILVTGGAGFIGSNLCRELLKHNKVICVDNLYSGSMDNIRDLVSNKYFLFFKTDIVNSDFAKELPKVDEIYHLACAASPPFYQAKPIDTIKTCVQGTINVLDEALLYKAKVLFTSTSEVYGEPLEHPQTEEYRGNVNTLGLRACYDEGKRLAETLMMEYKRLYGLDVKIVRIFNTYGPGMNPKDGRVVTNIISQILRNEDITVYGDGKQTRSFCYIDDMVSGLVKTMNSTETGPINLGNDHEITILELIGEILKIDNFCIKTQSKLKFLEIRKDDPTKRRPNISKAKDKLNWEPTTSLSKGLEITVNYIKRILNK